MRYGIIIIMFLLVLEGCELFSTRDPEPPSSGRNNFEPPTSAQIVIKNITLSFNNKNAENYNQCISDTNNGGSNFIFVPTTYTMSRFPQLFNNWNKSDEGRVINSIIANVGDEIQPELSFSTDDFEILTPDSAVFVSDYLIDIPHHIENIPVSFSGSCRFTIAPNKSQLWSIISWIDYSNNQDSLDNSWSALKALFSN